MLLKATLGHFLIEHMAEQLVIDPHLKALLDFANVEQAAINDKGMIVSASIEAGFLGLVKDLAVNGQFRFAADQRIIQDEVVAARTD